MLALYLSMIDEPNDKEKFSEIYKAYKNRMLNEAMSILHNHALAEEAVQESFLKIAKNISDFSDGKGKNAALILVIVRNVSLDIIKSEHLNEKEQLNDDIPDISVDILSKVMLKDRYNDLISAVKDLDNIYSDVLLLKIVYGYSNDEISSLLNIPKRTVETRFYRGKKILQKNLEELYGKDTVTK